MTIHTFVHCSTFIFLNTNHPNKSPLDRTTSPKRKRSIHQFYTNVFFKIHFLNYHSLIIFVSSSHATIQYNPNILPNFLTKDGIFIQCYNAIKTWRFIRWTAPSVFRIPTTVAPKSVKSRWFSGLSRSIHTDFMPFSGNSIFSFSVFSTISNKSY